MPPSDEPDRPEAPAEIGGYRVLRRLGAGGQGTVYLGADADGNRAAVKVLNPDAMDDADMRRRFQHEADAARSVASFCTAAVLTADFSARPPFIASEYVEGESLHERVRRTGPLEGGDLQRLAVNTATALAAIHEAGVVHRDFKPGNVLLGEGGARVIDFGIAQAAHGADTRTQSVIGTPAYMAPEQIAAGDATAASDVFAWGAVVAFAATGASPFDGPAVPSVLHSVINAEPGLDALPEPLRSAAAAALAKDPAARPSSVGLVMALLGRDEATVRLGGTATAPLRGPGAAPPQPGGAAGAPRRWLPIAAAGAAAAALLAGVLFAAGSLLPDRGSEPRAPSAEGGPGEEGGPGGDGTPAAEGGIPEFTADEGGTWEGVGEGGAIVTLTVAEGERSAALSHPECAGRVTLTEQTGRRFTATPSEAIADCVHTVWSARDIVIDFTGTTAELEFYSFDLAAEEMGPLSRITLARAG